MQPIAKVASGGELSRIALAIQVITARKMETPALIFDEVDVGISGPTAAVCRQTAASTRRINSGDVCTHLPQVAGCGHQHYFVSKETDGAMTETHMQSLNKKRGYKSWRACLVAVKSHVIHWRMRKNCLQRKLFSCFTVRVNSKTP